MMAFCCLLVSKELMAQQTTIERLPRSVNTFGYHEISPIVSYDGKKLFFTRIGDPDYVKKITYQGQSLSIEQDSLLFMRVVKKIFSDISGIRVQNPQYSAFNQDIIQANLDQKENITSVIRPLEPLNNALPNSICSPGEHENEYIIHNEFFREGGMKGGFSRIYQISDSVWHFPEPLFIDGFYSLQPDINLFMNRSGDILVFSMSRNDSSGDNDLYVSFKGADERWGSPQNMGTPLNTSHREIAPYLSADGKTIYFSSNRPGTLGGMDVFVSNRLDNSWKKWSMPKRLDAPINSLSDESQPFLNESSGYLYFCSKRNGTSDIYRAKVAPSQKQTFTVYGKIIHSKTGERIQDVTLLLSLEKGVSKIGIIKSGLFRVDDLTAGTKIKIQPSKMGFIGHPIELMKQDWRGTEIVLKMDALNVGARISLDPIYFVQSKALVQHASIPQLEYLADVLKKYHQLHISIEGHTDNNGDVAKLVDLSKQRAQTIRNYLIKTGGIAKERLITFGFGPSKPINDNSTEELRRKNRRVEVKITKIARLSDR